MPSLGSIQVQESDTGQENEQEEDVEGRSMEASEQGPQSQDVRTTHVGISHEGFSAPDPLVFFPLPIHWHHADKPAILGT